MFYFLKVIIWPWAKLKKLYVYNLHSRIILVQVIMEVCLQVVDILDLSPLLLKSMIEVSVILNPSLFVNVSREIVLLCSHGFMECNFHG